MSGPVPSEYFSLTVRFPNTMVVISLSYGCVFVSIGDLFFVVSALIGSS